MSAFEGITITGVDREKSEINRSENCFIYYFTLSTVPPQEGVDIFNTLWSNLKKNMQLQEQPQPPDIEIIGDRIKLLCPLYDERLDEHLEKLRGATERANKEYPEQVAEKWQAEAGNEEIFKSNMEKLKF